MMGFLVMVKSRDLLPDEWINLQMCSLYDSLTGKYPRKDLAGGGHCRQILSVCLVPPLSVVCLFSPCPSWSDWLCSHTLNVWQRCVPKHTGGCTHRLNPLKPRARIKEFLSWSWGSQPLGHSKKCLTNVGGEGVRDRPLSTRKYRWRSLISLASWSYIWKYIEWRGKRDPDLPTLASF